MTLRFFFHRLFVLIFVASVLGLDAQPEFGIKASLNLANFRLGGLSGNPSNLVSFRLGGIVDLSISEAFSLQPGVFLNSKGAKYSDNAQATTFNPLYFEAPVLMLGKFDVGGVQGFAGTGPFVGFGFAGKTKYQSGSITQNSNIQFGNSPRSNFKPVDFGLSFTGGVELDSGIILALGYDFSLVNHIPTQSFLGQVGGTAQHRILFFSIGYFFN